MHNLKILAEYINEKVPACSFVGLSSDQELFVEFKHTNTGYMTEAKAQIISAFPELKDVIAVVKPSISEVTEMVKALNDLLDEERKPVETKPLLDIGSF